VTQDPDDARRRRGRGSAAPSRRGRPPRTHTVAALAAVLSVGGWLGSTGPASAQEPTDEPPVLLTVSELTGVLRPGSVRPPPDAPTDDLPIAEDLEVRLLVENLGEAPLDELELVTEVHPAVQDRDELRDALDGEPLGQPLHVHRDELDGGTLAPGELRGAEDVMATDEVAWADAPGGVHPLRVAVTRGSELLAEVVTAVVWLDELPTERLATTAVWRLDGVPWRSVEGAYASGVDGDLRPGGRLDVLLAGLERHGSEEFTLAPAAHLLEDLGDRSDGYTSLERQPNGELLARRVPASSSGPAVAADALERVRGLASSLPTAPVTSTYADSDLGVLLEGDQELRDLAALAAADGRRRVQLQLGTDVDLTTHLLQGRLEAEALDLLPGDQLLAPSDSVRPVTMAEDPVSSPVHQVRAPSGRLLTVLVADPTLERSLAELDHEAGAVVAAQRPLVETAMAYLEAPDRSGRGLVILPPPGWDPPAGAATRLVDGLAAAPWLQLVSAHELAATARSAPGVVELATPTERELPPGFVERLGAVSRDLAAAAASRPDESDRLDDRSVAELRDDLLRATSSWDLGPSGTDGEALVASVERTIEETFGEVEVVSGGVTLTSDTGQIPVTLQRTSGDPILVDVVLDSPGTLQWPEGRTAERLLLEEDASRTVTFPTRAQSTGSFPVTVRVTDPSGGHELVRSTIAVRSTAISTPALGTIALVVLGLLLAGILRRNRATDTSTEDDSGPPAEDEIATAGEPGPPLRLVDRGGPDG
jgi:hypothetical protein